MSNTSLGAATKGSKLGIQRLAQPENKHIMDEIVIDTLQWLSPLRKEEYREYRMNNSKILNLLGITKDMKERYFKQFWPSPQPEWDGIAIDTNKILYLFEAKSHFQEFVPGKKGNHDNDNMKYSSIMNIAKKLFGIENTPANKEYWCKQYYQIANRIAFQQKLITIARKEKVNYVDVKMIFLNFVNDRTWEKEKKMVRSANDWDIYYDNKILPLMKISRKQLTSNNIYIINVDLDILKQ